MVGSVSRHTSLLVTNDARAASRKVRAAAEHGTPVVREDDFRRLLANIAPGAAKVAPADQFPVPAQEESSLETRPGILGPLTGRRVLVIGGDHRSAGDMRSRVAEQGGSVAVNLSRSVTDVIVLSDGVKDPRCAKAKGLGLRFHGPELVTAGVEPLESGPTNERGWTPLDLKRGQAVDLPVEDRGTEWSLRVTWGETTGYEVDVVAFVLDDQERVSGDEDFIFFNQPVTPGARLQVNSASDQCMTLALNDLPDQARRIVIGAVVDGEDVHFGDVGPVEIEVTAGDEGVTVARATLDAATTERSLRLVEIYRRNGRWRLRSVGQGYESGLGALATRFGVEVD